MTQKAIWYLEKTIIPTILTWPPIFECETKVAIGRELEVGVSNMKNKVVPYIFHELVQLLQMQDSGFLFGYKHFLRQNSNEHALIALSWYEYEWYA